MALVRDANGNLVDDGLGPQGRPAAPRGLAAAAATPPAIGGAGQRGAVPSYTVTSTAGGPRGTGPVITPTAQPATQTPAPAQSSSAAAAQPAATPAQPAMDPQIAAAFAERDRRRANNAVLEQDRANLRQAGFAPIVGPQPETSLSQDTLAATNQRIQAALDANRAPTQIPGERGNYNLANTSNVDAQGRITTRLRQPDNIIEGGYGQFGGGRAAQFLASRRNTGGGGGMSTASEEVRLRNQLTSNDPFERQAAREQMAARQALQLDAGATERQGMQLEGEQARAQVAGLAAVQAAEAAAAGRQSAAQLAGEYGVRQAETTALGRVIAEQAKEGSAASGLARINAEREALLVDEALAALAAGDDATAQQWLGVPQGPVGRVVADELGKPIGVATPGGVRGLTPQELAELQAAAAQQSVRPPQ